MRWIMLMGCGVVVLTGCAADDGANEETGANSSSDGSSAETSGVDSDGSSGADSSTAPSDTSESSASSDSDSGSGSTGSTGDTEATTGDGVCPDVPLAGLMSGIAIRWGDIPPDPTGGGDSTSTSGGEPDPDALLVVVRSFASTCDDAVFGTPCGDNWSVSFSLPPDMQEPGVYDLDAVNGGMSVTSGPGPKCGGGGGTLSGTLEIISIDDDQVVGRFCNTDAFDFDANGAWTAERCP